RRFRFFGGILLPERPYQIHQIPAHFFRGAIAFTAQHLALAVAYDVEQLAVGAVRQRGRVPPIEQLQLHLLGQISFAVALLAVAHRAVIPVELSSLGESLRGRRHRILFREIFGGGFVFDFVGVLAVFRLVLRRAVLGFEHSDAHQQKRAQDPKESLHALLQSGLANEGTDQRLPGFYSASAAKRRESAPLSGAALGRLQNGEAQRAWAFAGAAPLLATLQEAPGCAPPRPALNA